MNKKHFECFFKVLLSTVVDKSKFTPNNMEICLPDGHGIGEGDPSGQ